MKPITTADLAASYTAGASLLQLEAAHDLCHSAILYRLRRAGVAMRRCGARRGNANARRRADPPPPSPGGNPIPGDEEYED